MGLSPVELWSSSVSQSTIRMVSGRMVSGWGLVVADAIRRMAPMLKLTLETDLQGFERQVDDHMARAFQPAVVEALNAAGEAAVDAV
ncbi:hypothetical protein MFUR16E_13465 [Methylobacterium fujisawaense]